MVDLKENMARGLLWGILNNGMMQILTAIIGIFTTRLLSPSDYGVVAVVAVFTSVASCLQESGFTVALTNMDNPQDRDYNSVFWFNLLVSISLYIALFFSTPLIAMYFHEPVLRKVSRIIFITIILNGLGTVPAAYMFKNMMVKENTILRTIAMISSGLVGVGLAFVGFSYWSLVWQQITYVLIISIGRFFLITWKPSFYIDFGPVCRMFSFSYKILITSIITVLNQNFLTFVFGRVFPMSVVGNFNQANKWNGMASSFISGTVAQVAQPVFVAVNDDSNRQIRVFRKMLRFTAFLAFPAMFGLAIVAKEFIYITITSKWAACIPILQILCISGSFLPFYTLYQNLIMSKAKSGIYMWCTLLQIIFQILLILLTYRDGIIFMISVNTIFSIFWLSIWQWQAHRLVCLRLCDVLKDIMPFFIVSAVVMGTVYILTMPITNLIVLLVSRILLAAVFYAGIMKISHAVIFDECVRYFMKKRR